MSETTVSDNEININKKLLIDLFHIPAQSGSETQIQIYILNFLKEREIPYVVDNSGNIFNIDKKDKPLLCAHMDTVQDNFDIKLTHLISIKKDKILNGYGVIGGDDKCGLYIILDLLENNSSEFNFLFCVEEETGMVGSTYFMQENDISDLPYGLILDRNGSGDIICYLNDYGSKEFENKLKEIGKKFDYKPVRGLSSDADNLSDQINCANLSVGYYKPHTKQEFVFLPNLANARNYVIEILDKVKEKFEVNGKKFKQSKNYWNLNDEYLYEDNVQEGMEKAFSDKTKIIRKKSWKRINLYIITSRKIMQRMFYYCFSKR